MGGSTVQAPAARAGVLHKWTNYAFGWQDRYFEIRNGALVYYRSKADRVYGCRGSIGLKCATITVNELDENRFEVSANDTTWHLRAASPADRQLWLQALNAVDPLADSDYSSVSTNGHSRNASLSSLPGGRTTGVEVHQPQRHEPSPFTHSNHVNNNVIKEDVDTRIDELSVYRDLCAEQMAQIENSLEESLGPGLSKPNVLALKATHLALLDNINRIIQILNSKTPDASPSKEQLRLEKKLVEAYASQAKRNMTLAERATSPDPDDEMWHDAHSEADASTIVDETMMDEERSERGAELVSSSTSSSATTVVAASSPTFLPHRVRETHPRRDSLQSTKCGDFTRLHLQPHHYCADDIERLTTEQLRYAWAGVEDAVWSLFAEDGEMKMYKREVDIDGLPCDPLKAVHSVKGVSALEYMHHFFDPRYKKDWDHSLERVRIVEEVAPDTVVLHQIHKTVWPTAQRESLFWSHMRRVQPRSSAFRDAYIVCNKDVTRDDAPLSHPSCVRVGLTVAMVCETMIRDEARHKPDHELTRDDISCSVLYVSQVHPGGWVPAAALRVVYKREYPKFLKLFTDYVEKKVRGQALEL